MSGADVLGSIPATCQSIVQATEHGLLERESTAAIDAAMHALADAQAALLSVREVHQRRASRHDSDAGLGDSASSPSLVQPATQPMPIASPVPGPAAPPVLATRRALVAPDQGIRILAMDGGGIRGLALLEMLRKIEADTGRRIKDMFDLVVGTSTGGFLAAMVATGADLDATEQAYNSICATMADVNATWAGVKRFAVGASHDHTAVETFLHECFGSARASDTPLAWSVVAAAADMSPPQPYIMRSYELTPQQAASTPFMGTSKCSVVDAVQATTCAPTFYRSKRVGSQRFVDGAILAQNPVFVAMAEAQALWPNTPVHTILSLGTGTMKWKPSNMTGVVSWIQAMVDLSMNPFMCHYYAEALLPKDAYYRFDPDGLGDVWFVEHRASELASMMASCSKYIARESPEFARLAQRLGIDAAHVTEFPPPGRADRASSTASSPALAATSVAGAMQARASSLLRPLTEMSWNRQSDWTGRLSDIIGQMRGGRRGSDASESKPSPALGPSAASSVCSTTDHDSS